jgi:hypothetical protein
MLLFRRTTQRSREFRLLAVLSAFPGKCRNGPGVRDIHTCAANRTIDPSGMLHHGRDSPELAKTLRALDINNMNQLETLIEGFRIA